MVSLAVVGRRRMRSEEAVTLPLSDTSSSLSPLYPAGQLAQHLVGGL